MNDESLGHAVALIEGSVEILQRQIDGRNKIQADKFQRMKKVAIAFANLVLVAEKKQE